MLSICQCHPRVERQHVGPNSRCEIITDIISQCAPQGAAFALGAGVGACLSVHLSCTAHARGDATGGAQLAAVCRVAASYPLIARHRLPPCVTLRYTHPCCALEYTFLYLCCTHHRT